MTGERRRATKTRVAKRRRWGVAAVALVLLAACGEVLPTAHRDELVEGGLAIQVTLPFEDFGTRVRVFGGYGRASQVSGGFIARDYGARGAGSGSGQRPGLEAATLLRFGSYPTVASLPDTAGTTRPDSSLTLLSGTIVARFDTDASVAEAPVRIWAHALDESWDAVSASWDYAVDTPGTRLRWSESGGGAVEEVGHANWDPSSVDSVVISVDSARIASWADTTTDAPGIRLTTDAPGVRLRLRSSVLRLRAKPSINPDTVIEVTAPTVSTTAIYTPVTSSPGGWLQVGGAPAWRTVLDLDIPRALSGPAELCQALPCPVELTEERISYASLRLTTREGWSAFAPTDSLSMDLRMVTLPEILPKSPLGPSEVGIAGVTLAPEWFAREGEHVVEVPVTDLVRDLLRGETEGGDPVTGTVALLSTVEPWSIEYVTFEGPASPGAPALRMILNIARGGGE